ncbi:FG-GAP-like repeat-containing protein [uncultured Microbulbifer sp.]|uniref:FG-GAP repeat domain-containing protein n=1 Tax=uncultured Microbulbifer sp. TaxID=348147 RepID=UPI00262FE86B|nr:FG-GAP-like repeat-containing protein [uncultured Microbulbifer sp.]
MLTLPPSIRPLLLTLCTLTLTACGGGGGSGGGASSSSSSSGGNASGSSGSSSSSSSSSGGSNSSSSSGGPVNRAPEIANLAINPVEPYTNTPLSANLSASDPDGGRLDYKYTWLVNGSAVTGESSGHLHQDYFARGDEVQLEVTVSDQEHSVSQVASATILNSAPVVQASAESQVTSLRNVWLYGNVHDADDDELTYHWEQVSGPEVTLRTPDAANTAFTSPDETGELVFQLTVSDDEFTPEPAQVRIQVRNNAPDLITLAITPEPAFTDTTLESEFSVLNYDGRELSYVYTWMVNDQAITDADGETLAPEHFRKGDVVTLTLEVTDGLGADSMSTHITIADSPAVLSVSGAPETAEYGEPVSFQINAEDADAEPVELAFLARPNGMSIDDSGLVSWTPGGPLFSKETDFNWAITDASNSEAGEVGGTIRVIDEDRQYPLSRSGIEVPKNREQIRIRDLDKDGDNELLITDGHSRLFTLTFNGTDYVQDWLYPFSLAGVEQKISSIAAADLDGDNHDEIFVGISSSHFVGLTQLLVLDGATRTLKQFVELDGNTVKAIYPADLDNDGELELALLINSESSYDSPQVAQIRNATTLELEWSSSELALGNSMALGNVDNDAGQELVFSKGYVYGFNGATYVNEWIHGTGFGYGDVHVGDVDADGVDEIVGVTLGTDNEYYLEVFDVREKASVASRNLDYRTNIALGNLDSDPALEILRGYGAAAHSFDRATGLSEDWVITGYRHDPTALTIGDSDNDGAPEILWADGTDSTGEDTLHMAGMNPGFEEEWTNLDPSQLDGPFLGGERIALASGEERLAFATLETDSGYGDSRILYFNPVTGDLDISSTRGRNWTSYFAFCPVDFNSDGIDELFIATSEIRDPQVYLYEPASDSNIWTAPPLTTSGVAVDSGDLNGDDLPDLVVTTYNAGAYAYDASASTLLWNNSEVGGVDIAVTDLDGDGTNEIISASPSGITITAGESFNNVHSTSITALEEIYDNSRVVDMAVGDIDGDGKQEIAVVTSYYSDDSWVLVYESNLTLRSVFQLENVRDYPTIAIEGYGDGARNLLVSTGPSNYYGGGSAFLRVLDPASGREVSRSPELISASPKNSLYYLDINGDGIVELSFGTGASMNVTR